MWLNTDLNICESEKIYIMPFSLVIQLNTFEGENLSPQYCVTFFHSIIKTATLYKMIRVYNEEA